MDQHEMMMGGRLDSASRDGLDMRGARAPPRAETVYQNNMAQDNARVHYGPVYNFTAQPLATIPPMSLPVYHDHSSSAEPGASRWIRALQFDGMDSRLNTIRSAHHGTCEWLFERIEYKAWRTWQDPRKPHQHHGFLWLRGKPGTGKSTIMKSAHARGVIDLSDDVILNYFFSARSSQLQSSAEGMYRSLLCQLLEKFSGLPALVQSLKLRPGQPCVAWNKESLEVIVLEAILAVRPRQLTCYVDAIDECEYSDAQQIIDFFEDLHRKARESHVKVFVFVSSRHYRQLTCRSCQSITLEHEAEHTTDVSLYIRDKLQIGESNRARRIRAIIQQKASGVFLWVVLIVQILNEDKNSGRAHLMEQHLETLPKELHRLFENILDRDSDAYQTLLLTFQWLLFADRPLRLDELYFALLTSESPNTIQYWDQYDLDMNDMEDFVLNASRGLVEITKGTIHTVQFIHESVQEYLRDIWMPSLHGDSPSILARLSHDRLKQCCQQYVSSSSPRALATLDRESEIVAGTCQGENLRARINDAHPFLSYALDGMISHANASLSLGQQQHDFINNLDAQTWMQLHSVVVKGEFQKSLEVSRNQIFVMKNAVHLVRASLAQQRSSTDAGYGSSAEEHRFLLGIATTYGYSSLVELLLEHGTDPNALAKDSLTFLEVAAMQGHADVVRALLDHGVAVERSASLPRSVHTRPLRLAAEAGHIEVVTLLLASAYGDGWHPDMGHVLEAAIYRREIAMAHLLYGRMDAGRKEMVRLLTGAVWTHRRSISEALENFQDYYSGRDRSQFALLDQIHWANERYCVLGKRRLSACTRAFEPTRTRSLSQQRAIERTAAALLSLLRCTMWTSPLMTRLWAHHAIVHLTHDVAGDQAIEVSMWDDNWNSLFGMVYRAFAFDRELGQTAGVQYCMLSDVACHDVRQMYPAVLRPGTLPTFESIFRPGCQVEMGVRFHAAMDILGLTLTFHSHRGQILQYWLEARCLFEDRYRWNGAYAFHGGECIDVQKWCVDTE